jgi:crotonobetainyl-CoA:carnitine CoA-transferase CaiB-like acyl-CoA transferase
MASAEIGATKSTKGDGGCTLVVELCEARTAAVSAATLQFAAATGADIETIVSNFRGGKSIFTTAHEYWSSQHPALAQHLGRGKKIVALASLKEVAAYVATKQAKEGKHVIFISNFKPSLLKAAGLDSESLRAESSALITVLVTPLAPTESEVRTRSQ